MKKDIKVKLIFLLILCLIISSVIFVLNPSLHFWKSKYDQKLSWCKIWRPMLNISINPDIAFCYGEGWKDYCKVVYPNFCPKDLKEVNLILV